MYFTRRIAGRQLVSVLLATMGIVLGLHHRWRHRAGSAFVTVKDVIHLLQSGLVKLMLNACSTVILTTRTRSPCHSSEGPQKDEKDPTAIACVLVLPRVTPQSALLNFVVALVQAGANFFRTT
ncbi:hypothetical protein DFH09DRAFT_1305167 [Mycena vulgaris]|nr:hypothetical protein DFH09DRAFT_1305167 [Mycena vulgaris]